MDNHIRALVKARRSVQKFRIQSGNVLSAMDRGDTSSMYRALFQRIHDKFLETEEDIEKAIKDSADDMPIVRIMTTVRGVGVVLAAEVASEIDIEKAISPSALCRYAGYAVDENGQAERLKRGQKAPYNVKLKASCYKVGESFLKTKSPYSEVYYKAKREYEGKHPDWPQKRIHLAAMRKMIKLWLCHLWEVWRTIEGLEVVKPYAVAQNPELHTYIPPSDFGWKVDW